MTAQPVHPSLRGRNVVLARPAGQADFLRDSLLALGAEVTLFPGMEIVPCSESAGTAQALSALDQVAWAIFVSGNAVRHGLAAIARHGKWPAGLRCAAVGAATAAALEAAGHGPVLRPLETEDSEGLLANPAWGPLEGRRIVIFRGQGGRETLATGLSARGAHVRYAEVYRRALPTQDPAPLRAALQERRVDCICALSAETLHNLFSVLGEASHARLRETCWVVPHPRVAVAARELGIACLLEAPGSADDAVLSTLLHHFERQTQ